MIFFPLFIIYFLRNIINIFIEEGRTQKGGKRREKTEKREKKKDGKKLVSSNYETLKLHHE